MKIIGYVLIILGLVWIISIMGGVISHTYLSLNELWGGIAFHTVCMVLGMVFLGRAKGRTGAA